MTIEQKVDIAIKRLDSAIKLYDPIEVFGLYSGGHDSFSACFVASQHPRFSGVVHINTGIGIEATHVHVRSVCGMKCWKIREMHAKDNVDGNGDPDPQIYEDLVLDRGFPGPAHHYKMYNRLKDRSLALLQRQCGCVGGVRKPKRVMYVSGCRSDESTRRMGNTKEVDVDGQRIWCAPIHDWTKLDTTELLDYSKTPRNPVVDLIHKSGECLCGAYASKGELQELSMWPETRPDYDRIVALEKKVVEAGFPWGWEEGPPKEYMEEKRGQAFMPQMKQYLCWSCNNNHGRNPHSTVDKQ